MHVTHASNEQMQASNKKIYLWQPTATIVAMQCNEKRCNEKRCNEKRVNEERCKKERCNKKTCNEKDATKKCSMKMIATKIYATKKDAPHNICNAQNAHHISSPAQLTRRADRINTIGSVTGSG